jgi:hypothetical protein
MPTARLPKIALCLALLCAAAPAIRALELGETKAQLLAQHGPPGAEDHARNVAVYFWEGWSAQVEFRGDKVGKLTYRRNWYLQEQEIASLLQSNGGAAHWRETTPVGSQNRQWARDDGAYASCSRTHPLSMSFESGLLFADSPVSAKSAVGPPSSPAAQRPPTFPQHLEAVPEPELPVADPPPAAPPSSNGSPALPTLPSAEIQSTVPEAPADAVPAPASDPVHLPALAPPDGPAAANSHGLGLTLSIVGILALGGIGAYLFKLHSRPTARKPGPAYKPEPAAPRTASSSSDLGVLRRDQFELLVAEIFRRQGCTVELSAALGAEDGIDLMLRRDSETILVQCKYWQLAEVGSGEIDEFSAAMISCGTPRGVLVTTGVFTADARIHAASKGIDLMDGATLKKGIPAVARPGENLLSVSTWIEDFIAHARIFDPECPVCQGTMTIRQSRTSGTSTWTCRSFPRCPGRREPRLALLPAPAAR